VKPSSFDHELLKKWFFLNRRSLPWRENPSPYSVWISEVMLQQTQVAVVIPYFERWMRLFPSVQDLAEASREAVIKAWEGLGYYSRARNLHEGARYLVENHGGELPEEASALKKVKGLGPYTIGAIQSFAFKRKAPAVDGNVLRVFARLFAIEDPIDLQRTRRLIEEMVASILPEMEPWIVMEALIELGALVCQKKPSCVSCPLKANCLALRQGKTEILPKKGKKIPTTFLHRLVPIITSERGILVKQGELGKVMADLWEFPYIEVTQPIETIEGWHQQVESHFSLTLTYKQSLPEVSHGFTRFKAFLYPHVWHAKESHSLAGYEWASKAKLLSKPFSSGHRRVLTFLIRSCISC